MKKVIIFAAAIMIAVSVSGCSKELVQNMDENYEVLLNEVDMEPATIDEIVLIDTNDFLVKAIGVENDGPLHTGINLYVENNSNRSVRVIGMDYAINSICVDALIDIEVSAGESSEGLIYITPYELQQKGIEDFSVVEFKLMLIDADTWETFEHSGNVIIETSNFEYLAEPVPPEGTVLYDKNDILIIYTGHNNEEVLVPELPIYISNKSDKNLDVRASNISINGFVLDEYTGFNVAKGRIRYDTIHLDRNELKKANIESIDEIELVFSFWENSYENDGYLKIDSSEVIAFDLDGNMLDESEYHVDSSKEPNGIDGELLYNNEGIRMYYLGLKEASEGTYINFYIDNSSNNIVRLNSQGVAINDYMSRGGIYVDIGDDKKTYQTIFIQREFFEEIGTKTIEEIELAMEFSTLTKDEDTVYDEKSILINTGLTAEKPKGVEGPLIMDNSGVKMHYVGLTTRSNDDDYFGFKVHVENNTDSIINLNALNLKINGIAFEDVSGGCVLPGKKSYVDLRFRYRDVIDNGVEKIERIEFTMFVVDRRMAVVAREEGIVIEP